MSEDKFEEFLQREAQAYNPPPATAPRDEMWTAIERSREATRRDIAASTAAGRATTAVGARVTRRRARYAPWIGMAATLLIGVGIGRYAMDRGPAALLQDQPVAAGSQSAALGATPDDPSSNDSPDARMAEGASPDSRAAGSDAPDTRSADSEVGTVIADTRRSDTAPRSTQAIGASGDARDMAAAPSTIDNAGVPAASRSAGQLSPTYAVASQRHLQRAEALVAVVAAAPRDPMMDSLTSLWARDVLTNTRLMLDSPVGDDPIRRRLLEDLENLLVQLVQRSGPAVEERALIDRTLQRTQLLTRLRTSASGT